MLGPIQTFYEPYLKFTLSHSTPEMREGGCGACRAKGAHCISDARGSSGARTSFTPWRSRYGHVTVTWRSRYGHMTVTWRSHDGHVTVTLRSPSIGGEHTLQVTHAVRVAHAHRLPRWDPTNPPPLRIRSPRGPPEGRPPFPSSWIVGYLNLVQWSDLLIHGRPTTHFSTAC